MFHCDYLGPPWRASRVNLQWFLAHPRTHLTRSMHDGS